MKRRLFAALLAVCFIFNLSACEIEKDLQSSSDETVSVTEETNGSDSNIFEENLFWDEDSSEENDSVVSVYSVTEEDLSSSQSTTSVYDKTDSSKTLSTSSNTVSSDPEEAGVTSAAQDGQDTMVWIPTNGGTKYHSKSSCSKMKNPDYVTKSEAISKGFEPCKRCN